MYSIETKSLTKSFGDLVAVNDISFSVEKGEIFGFLGPNGAGKSTTMMIFTTLLKPTNGNALVGGFDVLKNPKQVRENIGFVQQETTVDEYLSGRENLLLQAKLNHIPKNEINQRIDEVLDLIELSDKQDEAVVTYSGGMRKRLDIAGGLLHHPRVLFLDEPTIGLDIVSQKTVRDFLKDLNKTKKTTIILTSHYMADIQELCKRVLIIDHGKLFYDGELQGILDQFADEKRINVLFEDPSMPLPEKCKSIGSIESFADGKLQIRVNRKAVVQASKDLLDMLPVAGLWVPGGPPARPLIL